MPAAVTTLGALMVSDSVAGETPRKVGCLLAIGIFLAPLIFVWFTLRRGHSTLSRVLSFGWLALAFLLVLIPDPAPKTHVAPQASLVSEPAPAPTDEPATEADDAPAEGSRFRLSKITAEEYARLESGMSYRQAVAIIGEEGEELSRTDMAGYTTIMYGWTNWDGSNANAMFQNGALVSKAQFGLR